MNSQQHTDEGPPHSPSPDIQRLRPEMSAGKGQPLLPLADCQPSVPEAEPAAGAGAAGMALAHEMLQPLCVIRLMIQSTLAELEKVDRADVVKQDLQAGLAACAKITAMVNRFRAAARPPGEAKEIDVDVADVAQWTIRLLEPSARQARVALRTESLEGLPALRMRENELEQLFFALVQNAVQAADGARDRCLLMAGTGQGDRIVLRFQDDCGGIAPAHVARVFEPFFTTKPPGRSTGLGLCIARRIARQRGGDLLVESDYGRGTTVTAILPRNRIGEG